MSFNLIALSSLHLSFVRCRSGLGFSRFSRRYSGNNFCSHFLWLLKCFTSPGLLSLTLRQQATEVYSARLPHSEISGSQVATHLPEAYRCYATSFIAFSSLGIHHSPLIANHPNADLYISPPARTLTYADITQTNADKNLLSANVRV